NARRAFSLAAKIANLGSTYRHNPLAVLEVEGLAKRYGEVLALKELTVRVEGIDAEHDPAAVRARVGLMPEVPGLYERMSARAYLDHFGAIYDLEPSVRRRRIDDLLEMFELTDAGDRW